jgi:hypothetical protein
MGDPRYLLEYAALSAIASLLFAFWADLWD